VTDETPNPTAPEPDPAPTSTASRGPEHPPSLTDVRAQRPEYRGAELDPERGPGLGCFWFQVIVLGFFIVLIPIGLNLNWPFELLAILLFVVIGLLLLTGQTVIFLLRLVAAERRVQGRRRPLASPTKTVGELEDEHRVANAVGSARPAGTVPPAPATRRRAARAARSGAATPAAPATPGAATPGEGAPASSDEAGPGEPPEEPDPGVRQ
jgi:hypothetical protein